MPKPIPALLRLSTAQLKRMLAARERIDVLEQEKAKLVKALTAVEGELSRLLAEAAQAGAPARRGRPAGRRTKKATARKTAKKATGKSTGKTAKKTTAKKATTKKTTAKKTTAKKTTGKKTAAQKRAVRKSSPKTVRKQGGRVRLEDVIVAVLKRHGGKLAFKDLHAAIVDGKLYRTRSADFANVLRRTLSTSGRVERVGRGLYAVA